ncbi:phage terminase small subunit P27 family [Lacticaseibacillus mingshuiensis]|uniref:Phage terminase small subunit P27 family n=1 Tax=Lacticaseibacillus mingshuiensis TaxID=2799574 RepID=A0ABW4CD32_9LACO|nr:phage terminase small subunit P27 family [Lacticaseibacillus mingshuiensis]
MGRKMKITTDMGDRADQRRRTEELMNQTKDWQTLQPTPPRYMSGIAYAAWHELVPILNQTGLVKQGDKQIVSALCEQIAVRRQAYTEVMMNGIVLANGRKNPACQVLDSATSKVKSLAESLGLSPQARASLMNVQSDNADEDTEDIVAKLRQEGSKQF